MRQIIDLSIAIENDVRSDPEGFGPNVMYMTHEHTFEQIGRFFPGLTQDQLPDSEAWAVELVTLSTHNGTHIDAPWHYHSTQDQALPDGKRRAMTIEEMPLDWAIRPGVKLDFRHLPDGHVVSAAEVEAELARIDYRLQPLDIVVVNTRAGGVYGSPEYLAAGCGMGREATLYLLEQGVRVVGTDAWSWDAPFPYTAQKWAVTKDPAIIWEGHKAGRDIGYFQMEKLHNLEVLPPFGFELSCLPVKIKNAGAGWIRAVAILNA